MKLDLHIYKDGEIYLYEENDNEPAFHGYSSDVSDMQKLIEVIKKIQKECYR